MAKDKQQKRTEAEARKLLYDQLTIEEKRTKAISGPGLARKQLNRL